MAKPDRQSAPCIWVLAGTNGAGKSSIGGAMIRSKGADYFNPDEAAQRIRAANPGLGVEEANGEAWKQEVRLLNRAIQERKDYAFESTLGGRTITRLLATAANSGFEVRLWYVGLTSPELHISRVRARVAQGGHDIPEEKIRSRFNKSRLNLIRLLPWLTELRLYDNSEDGDPRAGRKPQTRLLLHYRAGQLIEHTELLSMPDWAKPIFMAAKRKQPF